MDIPELDTTELDQLTDRELLLKIAAEMQAVRMLAASVIEDVKPFLNSPKFKLLGKML
jgi:hypothetical protein